MKTRVLLMLFLCLNFQSIVNGKEIDNLAMSEKHFQVAEGLIQYLEKHNNNGLLPRVSDDIQVAESIYELTNKKYLSDYQYFWSFKANNKVCTHVLNVLNYYQKITTTHLKNIRMHDKHFRGFYPEEGYLSGFLISCYGNQTNLINDLNHVLKDLPQQSRYKRFMQFFSKTQSSLFELYDASLNIPLNKKFSASYTDMMVAAAEQNTANYVRFFSKKQRQQLLQRVAPLKQKYPQYHDSLSHILQTIEQTPCEELCQYYSQEQDVKKESQ